MTDKEMARQIAEELVSLRKRAETMEILIAGYRIVGRDGEEIPWRNDLAEMRETNSEFQDLMHARDEQLRELLGDEEFESAPFRAVWRTYCQYRNR